MSRRNLALSATSGSAAIVIGALGLAFLAFGSGAEGCGHELAKTDSNGYGLVLTVGVGLLGAAGSAIGGFLLLVGLAFGVIAILAARKRKEDQSRKLLAEEAEDSTKRD